MTERKPQQEDWESFVERQIVEAQQAGEFDALPGFGKPMADADEPYDEDWWLKKKAKREKLSVVPPSLEIKRDVEKTLAKLDVLRDEQAVRAQVIALNDRIRQANFASVWGPPSTMMPLDVDEAVACWRRRRTEGE